MKKIILAVTLIASSFFTTQAQDETPATRTPIMSKRGYPILPEAGDWSISFNARPFLTYVGSIFRSGSGNNTGPDAAFTENFNQIITGRYFVDANTAYRVQVRLGKSSATQKNLVGDQNNKTSDVVNVEDKQTVSSTAIFLGAGLEKRKGFGRVQGIYGAQASIGLGSGKTSTTYGNSFNTDFPSPLSTTDFSNGTTQNVSSRNTENKNGTTFMIGVQGFLGVEYFIAPKISIGAEYAWGPSISVSGKGEGTSQSFNSTANSVKSTTSDIGGHSSFRLDNSVTSINLNFFF